MRFDFRYALVAAALAVPAHCGKFKFCKEVGWVNCNEFDNVQTARCYNLGAEWNKTCSSARSYGGISCYMWSYPNCMGKSAGPVLDNTRYRDLSQFGMDNESSSWECYASL
ncbi:hypothetical protein K469DRAFT_688616 [Zopfia rhizophila CBS 207.26]|uniref:Uncharacterized protein n=1 Tax=Zopfia rhizophila CBS 207.26 TaxID=1314779 RepID=A0A6A6DYH8_9PEZI|nr:hypothetical protein K469DRAFT_688616 [Zopfia rhizophila CBS 207.26]